MPDPDVTLPHVAMEMRGMASSVQMGNGASWRRQLEPPHPPEVSRAAGALVTTLGTLLMGYRVAYVLHAAGMLAPVEADGDAA